MDLEAGATNLGIGRRARRTAFLMVLLSTPECPQGGHSPVSTPSLLAVKPPREALLWGGRFGHRGDDCAVMCFPPTVTFT